MGGLFIPESPNHDSAGAVRRRDEIDPDISPPDAPCPQIPTFR